jgi:hypothetical protein
MRRETDATILRRDWRSPSARRTAAVPTAATSSGASGRRSTTPARNVPVIARRGLSAETASSTPVRSSASRPCSSPDTDQITNGAVASTVAARKKLL